MDHFIFIDKNKGMYCIETQNKYCSKYFDVFSIRKPNLRMYLLDNCSKKKYFIKLATGPFIALECHEWTTLFPSMDRMHYIGKCRFARAVMYYIL